MVRVRAHPAPKKRAMCAVRAAGRQACCLLSRASKPSDSDLLYHILTKLQERDWAAWFRLPKEERDAIKREERRAAAASAKAQLEAMGGACVL
jgi:hypothetical protein